MIEHTRDPRFITGIEKSRMRVFQLKQGFGYQLNKLQRMNESPQFIETTC